VDTSSATHVLGQFLLVSLLVERVVTVAQKLFGKSSGGSVLDTDPTSDPWQNWSQRKVWAAFGVGLLVCYVYDLDFFSQLLQQKAASSTAGAPTAPPALTWRDHMGIVLSAIVIAGGSTALQQIISAVGAAAKAAKADALAKMYVAQRIVANS
jgi:hypothetical protein